MPSSAHAPHSHCTTEKPKLEPHRAICSQWTFPTFFLAESFSAEQPRARSASRIAKALRKITSTHLSLRSFRIDSFYLPDGERRERPVWGWNSVWAGSGRRLSLLDTTRTFRTRAGSHIRGCGISGCGISGCGIWIVRTLYFFFRRLQLAPRRARPPGERGLRAVCDASEDDSG